MQYSSLRVILMSSSVYLKYVFDFLAMNSRIDISFQCRESSGRVLLALPRLTFLLLTPVSYGTLETWTGRKMFQTITRFKPKPITLSLATFLNISV